MPHLQTTMLAVTEIVADDNNSTQRKFRNALEMKYPISNCHPEKIVWVEFAKKSLLSCLSLRIA